MIAVIVVVYLGLNFVLNYGNKLLLESFHYPLFMILVGTLFYIPFSALIITLTKACTFPTWDKIKTAGPDILVIGVVHAIGTGAQNWSLSGTMSVGLNQVIKASTPAVTLVFSYLLQKRRFHWSLVVATLLVVCGTVLTTYASAEATAKGVLLSLISSLFGGLEGVMTDMLMKKHDLHAAQVTYLAALPAASSLVLPFFYIEFGSQFLSILGERGAQVGGFIFLLSCAAAAYSYSHYLLISSTSAHYCNLVGSVKLALIVGISFFVIDSGKNLSVLNLLGIAVTLLSFTAYTILRSYFPEKIVLHAPKPKEKTPVEEDEESPIDIEKESG